MHAYDRTTRLAQRSGGGLDKPFFGKAQKVVPPLARPSASFSYSAGNIPVNPPTQRREALAAEFDTPERARDRSGGLPTSLRRSFERLSGIALDDVRVQRNSPEPSKIGALAYAKGRDIHLGPGRERHLPHEAWHVVQQRQGRVRATIQANGVPINDDASLEREADQMSRRPPPSGAFQPTLGNSAPTIPSPFVAQRVLKFGTENSDKAKLKAKLGVDKKQVQEIKGWVIKVEKAKSEKSLPAKIGKHPLYKLLKRAAYAERKLDLLSVLESWCDDGEDHIHKDWEAAVLRAGLQHSETAALEGLTPEKREASRKQMEELSKAIPVSGGVDEKTLAADERLKRRRVLPGLARSASFATDFVYNGLGDSSMEGIKRRKLHKGGQTDLGTGTMGYRTYTGGMSPLPNAFVMGRLDDDYKPLFEKLRVLIERKGELQRQKGEPKRDYNKLLARLFLDEFAGKNAFETFSPEAQEMAHKIITIIFFAELSRQSIALMSAAATFHAVATRDDLPLEKAFGTDSGSERALFAGKGGAELMRSLAKMKDDKDASLEKDVETRHVRSAVDIQNFYASEGHKGEPIDAFVERKTLEYILALSPNTSVDGVKQGIGTKDSPSLAKHLKAIKMPTKSGATSLQTLAALGFTHVPQSGDENDCAIYTLYHQLTTVHHIPLGKFEAFRDYVRANAHFAFGAMIDIANNGAALLTAAANYIAGVLKLPAVALTLDAWSATNDGGLMEYQNVANGGAGTSCIVTFYYNGVNHFDSLTGGLARR